MTCGRLEALTIVPAGGWTLSVNDGVAYSATLTAATEYSGPTAVVAALVAALNTAATGAGSLRTWTGSIASGEQGTGYVTLTISAGANVTGTWTTTTLRDYLGWSANLSGAITFTSPSGALGLWLPDCPAWTPMALGESGNYEGGLTQTVSPAGVTKSIKTASRRRHPGITWTHVSIARARQFSEASGIRSWERFVRDCLRGDTGLAYFRPGGDVKVFWNADSGTPTPVVFHPVGIADVGATMQPADQSFVGQWRITWPGGFA